MGAVIFEKMMRGALHPNLRGGGGKTAFRRGGARTFPNQARTLTEKAK